MVVYEMQHGIIRNGKWNKENEHHQKFKTTMAREMLKHDKIIFKSNGDVITAELNGKPVHHFDSNQDSATKRMSDGDYLFLRMENINNHNADNKYIKFLIMRNNAEVQLKKPNLTDELKELWNNRKAYDEKMMEEALKVAKLPESKIEKWMMKSSKKPENPTADDMNTIPMWNSARNLPNRYNLDLKIMHTNNLKSKGELTPRKKLFKEDKKENDTNNNNTGSDAMHIQPAGQSQFTNGMYSDSELSEDDDISGVLNSTSRDLSRNLYM